MSIKALIPGTAERARKKLYGGLNKLGQKGDVLVLLEWDDDNASLEPAHFDLEEGHYETAFSGLKIYASGRGSDPKLLGGTPILMVDARNAGACSTEAAIMGHRFEHGEVTAVTNHGRVELEGVDPTDEEAVATAAARELNKTTGDGEVAADGGAVHVHDIEVDTNPPEGYHGQTISVKDATEWDPWPVTREDTKRSMEFAQIAENDDNALILLVYGIAIGAGLLIAFIFVMWLLGQIGGGGGGSVIPMTALLASTRGLGGDRQ